MEETIITPVVTEEKKEMKSCPHCHGSIPVDYDFCTFCGKKIAMPTAEEIKKQQEQSDYYKEYMKVMKNQKKKKMHKVFFITSYSISALMLLIGLVKLLIGPVASNIFGVDTSVLFSNMTSTICVFIMSFMFAYLGSFFYKIYLDMNRK